MQVIQNIKSLVICKRGPVYFWYSWNRVMKVLLDVTFYGSVFHFRTFSSSRESKVQVFVGLCTVYRITSCTMCCSFATVLAILNLGCLLSFLCSMAPVMVLWLAMCLSGTWAVDKSNFKTCDQSGFCKWVKDGKIQNFRLHRFSLIISDYLVWHHPWSGTLHYTAGLVLQNLLCFFS